MGLGAINANAINTIPINGSGGAFAFVLPSELPLGELICVPAEQVKFAPYPEQYILYATCEETFYLVPPEETIFRIPAGNRSC